MQGMKKIGIRSGLNVYVNEFFTPSQVREAQEKLGVEMRHFNIRTDLGNTPASYVKVQANSPEEALYAVQRFKGSIK